jgi:hypothetical protein
VTEGAARAWRVERDEVLVAPDARLPLTCLKCGARNHPKGKVTRRRETLLQADTRSGIVSGLGGALVAQAMRSFPQSAGMILLGATVVLAPVVWFLHHKTPRQVVELPLCTSCDARWSQGVIFRRAFVGAMVLGLAAGVAAVLGELLPMKTVAVGGGVAFVLVLLAAVTAKLPARFVTATRIGPQGAWLKGVDPAALARLSRDRAEEPRSDVIEERR